MNKRQRKKQYSNSCDKCDLYPTIKNLLNLDLKVKDVENVMVD
ncbi:hypothetical protein [Clostridium botulinum]|nr:hypothetical protein [Clostridium botulinum]